MQHHWLNLSKHFSTKQSFVLAVIVETRGSTYHKAGAMMLIDEQGYSTGLLSGGCLEDDISLHAQTMMAASSVKRLTYDLQSDDESIWGLGLGCNGALEIALLPLNTANQHLAFDKVIASALHGGNGVYQLTITDGQLAHADFYEDDVSLKNNPLRLDSAVLTLPIESPLHIVICGAGLDAPPLVAMMQLLGWRISIVDHRKATLGGDSFIHCYSRLHLSKTPEKKAELLQLFANADGVVIMTHSLERDGLLLKMALTSQLSYIGLLGPKSRRDKLAERNGINNATLVNISAPIGLDIGGRGPEAIALSICAEIQSKMSDRHLDKISSIKSSMGTIDLDCKTDSRLKEVGVE